MALESVRGLKTISEIAKEFEAHPVLVSQWTKELIERLPDVFRKTPDNEAMILTRQRERLEWKVGEMTMDIEFLKNKCVPMGIPLDEPQ